MYEMDKERFGAFVALLRKEQSLTQKDLAQRLFVSDKAVSKWERGLSLPDVALLIPLADALGVTVTELLEGQRMTEAKPMEPEQVEKLVQKALNLTEGKSRRGGPNRKLWGLVYFVGMLFSALLTVAVSFLCPQEETTSVTLWVMVSLANAFGLYFCLFAPDRLPAYYDENKIGFFADGPFRINLPGVQFNNTNWPRVMRFGRIWCLLVMVVFPAVIGTGCLAFAGTWAETVAKAALIIALVSLFAGIYLTARPAK